MSATEAKVAEARGYYEKAEKHLKTGLLKWAPDFDLAAGEYAKAATAFKVAKMPEKFLEANLKSADCWKQNNSFYHAAKAYDQCASMAKDLGRFEDCVNYIMKACSMYREHGVPDTAALTYDRGAKYVELKYPEKAAEFFMLASDTTMIEDRPLQAAEYVHKAARVYVNNGLYAEAVGALDKELQLRSQGEDNGSAGRTVVQIFLVQLARGDWVAAKRSFEEGQTFCQPEEVYTLTNLLDAWDQMDAVKVCEFLRNPFIMAMDTEYTKLSRMLQVKQSANIVDSSQNAAEGGGGGEAENDAAALM